MSSTGQTAKCSSRYSGCRAGHVFVGFEDPVSPGACCGLFPANQLSRMTPNCQCQVTPKRSSIRSMRRQRTTPSGPARTISANSSFCAALSRQGGSGGRRLNRPALRIVTVGPIPQRRRSMPQFSAAVLRSTPSRTRAIANIRRAAFPSWHRAASWRSSPADLSLRGHQSLPWMPLNQITPLVGIPLSQIWGPLVLYQRSLIRTHAPICACRGT